MTYDLGPVEGCGAYFGPLATALLIRHCTGQPTDPVDLDELADRYDRVGTAGSREAARQLRAGLSMARHSERDRRRTQAGRGSAAGTAEPESAAGGAGSVSTPRTHLTVVQVAEKAGVSTSYVKRLCRGSALSATKPGREWLIDAESFADWQTARTARRTG